MSADRRTLTIGAVAMVLLILVGVLSGALFARSACADIGPTAVAVPVAGGDLALLREVAPGLSPDELARWQAELELLVGELGPVTGVAAVGEAGRVTATSTGPAALGEAVVQLDATGSRATHAASVGTGTVVGGGAHLYSLALTNLLTGQVDALQPLDLDLDGLTCVDTALVGSPLAFHLDANEGQLLLLRIEDDGDDAELELRDPVAGRVWASELELPAAPAGLAGARLTAGLGPEVVVTGTRTSPGSAAPVLAAMARSDGAPRWQVSRDELVAAGVTLPDDQPTRAEVHHAGGGLALIGLRDVEGTGRADEEAEQDAVSALRHRIVGVDVADGTVRFAAELRTSERVVAATAGDAGGLLVTVDAGQGRVRAVRVDGDGAVTIDEAELRGPVLDDLDRTAAASRGAIGTAGLPWPGDVVVRDDGRAVVATGAGLLLLPPGWAATDAETVAIQLPVIALARHDGGLSLLLQEPDGDRLVVTFGG